MDPKLWPARNVAEFAYCPRLFYYMEVEGIHVPSSDTEEGQRIHRRVDVPSATPPESEQDRDAAELRKVRSLTLTSERLGLTATLDLAEIDGSVAVPVEYRKGRPRQVYDEDGEVIGYESWPTDRVQIGLQAILLEEAGYEVSSAAIYYAAEKRRLSLVVDDALRVEALETFEAARTCATGSRPLPLVNDSRCPRCSLQPVCLPDEINSLRETSETPSARKLWPPRDDGIHLVTQRRGTRVGIRASTLRVTEADGTKTAEVPLAGVESLSLVGAVQISTQALHTLADRGIPVAYLSGAGRLIACVDPLDAVSADTRRNQVRRLDCESDRVELSRALIVAKIRNQRVLLQRNGAASARILDALKTS